MINGIQIALLHHGLSLETTIFAAEFSGAIKMFSMEESEILGVVSLSTGKYLSLTMNSFGAIN